MYHRVGKCSPLSRDCFCSCFFSLFTCEHEFLNPILGKSFIPYRTDRSASEDGSVSVDPSLLTGLRKESPKGESFLFHIPVDQFAQYPIQNIGLLLPSPDSTFMLLNH